MTFKRGMRQVDLEEYISNRERLHKEALQMIEDGRPTPFTHGGYTYTDETPMEPPIGYDPQPSLVDRIRQMVRRELSDQAEADGFESFEDADDFDVEDDAFPQSGYEHDEEKPSVRELKKRLADAEAELAKRVSPARKPKPAKPSGDNPPSDGPQPDPDTSNPSDGSPD